MTSNKPQADFFRDIDFEYEEIGEIGEDLALSPEDFRGLTIAPTDWTIDSLFGQIGKQIVIDPDFQRRVVWNIVSKSQFIESLFLNIPIPQILLAAQKEERNKFLILDGKQRLSTIKEFIDGKVEGGKTFRLRGLRILKELNGKTWKEISSDFSLRDDFLNSVVRSVVLRSWQTEDVLFEVFYRLNSGSVKLSPMELRMSLHPGLFLKYIVKWTEVDKGLHKLLRLTGPDKRMADVELCLRYIGFQKFPGSYSGNLKQFLDDITKKLNSDWNQRDIESEILALLDNMEAAIELALEIFGPTKACTKWKGGKYESRFNRAIFDVQIGSLSSMELRNWAKQNNQLFEDAFIDLCETDQEFIEAIESTTKTPRAVKTRFTAWYEKISTVSGIRLSIPPIVMPASEA